MAKSCPICNFEPRSLDKADKILMVDCHDCGQFRIDENFAKIFRAQYLSFDMSTLNGRELYKHNIKVIRQYIVHHHKSVIVNDIIKNLPGMYSPYPKSSS